jgi:hypothetical protein
MDKADQGLGDEIEEMQEEIMSLLSEPIDMDDPELEDRRMEMQRESNFIIDGVVR